MKKSLVLWLLVCALVCIGLLTFAFDRFKFGQLKTCQNAASNEAQATALKECSTWANEGNPEAQFYIGYMYFHGDGGPQDYTEALRWFRKAAAQGNAPAQFELGNMYFEGQGVPQDYVQALMWLYLANAARPGLIIPMDIITRGMTQQQIVEAQRLAQQWKPPQAKLVRWWTRWFPRMPNTLTAQAPPRMPDTLTNVVAQAAMWVVDHNRPEGQSAVGIETEVISDNLSVPFIRQPNGRFILLTRESLRAAYGTSTGTALLIESLDHSQWLKLVEQSPNDRTVQSVRAACGSGVEVLVFHENGMIVAGGETYNPICDDVSMSSAEAPGATEQAWAFTPHTETHDRVVRGVISTLEMGNRGGSIELHIEDGTIQKFVFYECPGCPPITSDVWNLDSDSQGKRFELRYREVSYTGPISFVNYKTRMVSVRQLK